MRFIDSFTAVLDKIISVVRNDGSCFTCIITSNSFDYEYLKTLPDPLLNNEKLSIILITSNIETYQNDKENNSLISIIRFGDISKVDIIKLS